MKTSIIVPSYGRAEQLKRNMTRLVETVQGLDTEIIICAEVDMAGIEAVRDLPVITTYHADWRGSMANWNLGAAMATGDLLVLAADDIWWGDNWLQEAIAQMERENTCYCGLNDLMWDGWTQNVTHWAITRRGIIDYCGGCLMPPWYKTQYGDNEINARIKRAGQFTWAEKAIVDHQHHLTGKAQMDRTYRTVTRYLQEDQITFERRKALGFPDDFAPVVKERTE